MVTSPRLMIHVSIDVYSDSLAVLSRLFYVTRNWITAQGSKPTLANPTLAKPTLAKPTLAKPTLANVKVSVACKRFWFFGVDCLGFLKLIVQVFFVCFELTWVGAPKGGGLSFRAFFPVPQQNSFFSSFSGVFSWNFGGV